MNPDYTINDAFQDGFECGLLYVLRYAMEVESVSLTDTDVLKLADHLAAHKLFKPSEQWAMTIHNEVSRRLNRGSERRGEHAER